MNKQIIFNGDNEDNIKTIIDATASRGFVSPMIVSDKDRSSLQRQGLFASSGQSNFSNIAGKGKLCKGAGLTGAEKKACKKEIVSKCGHKGIFPSKAKKAKWQACSDSIAVSTEQAAQATADSLVKTADDSGMSMGVKFAIGAGVVGFIALIGFAIANKKRAKTVMVAQ